MFLNLFFIKKIIFNTIMTNSIQPKLWGPHGWKFMHYISLGYPINPTSKDKINYKNFYYSLQDILPCVCFNLRYILHCKFQDASYFTL